MFWDQEASTERSIEKLRRERRNLLNRINAGQSGVVELRARLKQVTHQVLKLELEAAR